ncbi:MAG TPA: YbaK/EbsC family protein [Methylocella sp.]
MPGDLAPAFLRNVTEPTRKNNVADAEEIRDGLSSAYNRHILMPYDATAHRETTACAPNGATFTHGIGGFIMAIAPTLQRYLDQNVTYGVIPHEPTMSSMRTAQICQISGDCLAKGIVLRHDSDYVLAVLPASHHIRLSELRMQLGDDVDLASENEIAELFRDCVYGAVPAVGVCYALDVIVDDSIEEQPEIYMEGGDHATLVHMGHAQFAQLTVDARHGCFSAHD